MVYEAAPAKVNFTLDIFSKRDGDYHGIEMIMTTVDLNDHLTFHKREDRRIVVEIERNYAPPNHKSLTYHAAWLFIEQYQLEQGVTVSIDKEIPASAGSAGGSADAVATLRGLNRPFNIGTSLEELVLLGSKVGTDIPFCIYSKTALYTGKEGKIEFLNKPPSAWVIPARPDLGILSPGILKLINLDKRYDTHMKMHYEALENRNYQQLCRSLSDRLEPISVSKHPQIDKLKNNMLKSGADGALMSGSGPTVCGLVQEENQAKNTYNAVNGCRNEVYLVRLLG